MIELFTFSISYQQVSILILTAVFIGMAKTGIHGAGMVVVPLLAIAFGGKASSGLLLPILIMADFFGVRYYHRHADWNHLKKLIPFAVIGVVIGTYIGEIIDDVLFRQIMSIIIFLSLGVMIWIEKSKGDNIPESKWFAGSMGVLGGVTTMVGNLAGSVMALYLLSMKLSKNIFIGTAAWFFLVINLIKVPFHVFSWHTITLNSFLLGLTMLPFIGIGALLGIKIVSKIPDRFYRIFIILMTAVAAIFMII